MRTRRSFQLLLCAAVLATVLVVPARAHTGLKKGLYECWLTQITTYSNFDLRIKDGGKYTWQRSDGTDKKNGTFERNGDRLNFKSGILKRREFKGLHYQYVDSFDVHTHIIYLYKGSWEEKDLKYDCNNN